MEWDSIKIKTLRRRLGWSQSDLARRLQIESLSVQSWEEGASRPQNQHLQSLELIFNQAELAALEISQSTQAEVTLHRRELESIDVESLNGEADKK